MTKLMTQLEKNKTREQKRDQGMTKLMTQIENNKLNSPNYRQEVGGHVFSF